jgi:hypothetical protein
MDRVVDTQEEVTAEQLKIVELPLETLAMVGGGGKEGTGLSNSY